MSLSRGTYKKEAYEQAVAFRKRGFTYTEIAKICDVSRGTISNWLAKEDFSKQIAKNNKERAYKDNVGRIKLVNKARNAERNTQYKEILRLAETEYKHYRSNPLFVAGLMLYANVGDKKHGNLVRITNNQPELHKIFIKFAIEYLGVQKTNLHFWLLLYPEHDEIKCMKHWSRKINLNVGQFYKNQVVIGRSNKQTLHFGVGNTIIGNTLLKKKLIHWVELQTKDLQK
ncbi:MAG: helix-turn-helix domain-containing protein [Candidatus Pacebacteria bacterium]|nr:helix-turn-helix domain-containing protein [Candidatus Paceibacterota bacterium]